MEALLLLVSGLVQSSFPFQCKACEARILADDE